MTAPAQKVAVLRHDVDVRKLNSLEFAKIQHERGICGTYYFRMVPVSFDEKVILQIHELGHEIGYHYEDMDFADGDPHKAIDLFQKHLHKLRKIAPVSTICMHGSPRSKYDNKDLWNFYNYKDYGIIGEPYFDLDFKSVFYLTDTGRMWDGHKVSVRDKVENNLKHSFHTTHDILACLQKEQFPNAVMFNFHPQRWMDHPLRWIREKYTQNLKNMIKYWLIKLRK